MCNRGRDETPGASRGVEAYLLFGSNLGDRRAAIERGLTALEDRGVEWVAVSSDYETEPVGLEDQPWFLNRAARGRVRVPPRTLLAWCQEAETLCGRQRGARFGPRTLDVDILLYGRLEVREPDLEIPHPRLRERAFALVPLLELDPQLVDFRDGASFASVLRGLGEGKKVARSTTRES